MPEEPSPLSIEQVLLPREKDLGGGFRVRRALPNSGRRSIGPFIFFDHFGPIAVRPGDLHDMRPHPHIGLAAVTYLFEGAILHRDSLGSVQRIEPGAINWMTAGRGVVHSERTPKTCAGAATPATACNCGSPCRANGKNVRRASSISPPTPAIHHGRRCGGAGADRRSLRRRFAGRDVERHALPGYPAAGRWLRDLPASYPERAVYSVDRPLQIDGEALAEHSLGVLAGGEKCASALEKRRGW